MTSGCALAILSLPLLAILGTSIAKKSGIAPVWGVLGGLAAWVLVVLLFNMLDDWIDKKLLQRQATQLERKDVPPNSPPDSPPGHKP